MSEYTRLNGRGFNEIRPIEAKIGVISRATGSAYFKIGNTVAYAAVYGPRELFPRFLKDPERGILRCTYNMMPFSGAGERIKPGPNRRAKEISLITEKALLPILDLSEFPNAAVDVFIELTQTDAGSRCAGLTAAALALADAGFVMKGLVAAVGVGRVGKNLIVDLDYSEDSHEDGVDIPVAMVMPDAKDITLLQMDGIIDKKMFKEAIELAKPALLKIYEEQKRALKENFQLDGE